MSSASSLSWFVRHEVRLAWREWIAMLTGGRRGRKRAALIGLVIFAALMHLPAYAVIGRFADLRDAARQILADRDDGHHCAGLGPDAVAGHRIRDAGVLRPRRSRSDHVLAGAADQHLFGPHRRDRAFRHRRWRCCSRRPSSTCSSISGGARWLAAFGVVIAIGLSAAAIAIAVTLILFRLIGPSRTRLVAQILAAVVGAGFVIALQVAAILSYGTLSRFAVLTSDAVASLRARLGQPPWWPARAALGDSEALLLLLAGGLVMLGAVMAIFSPRFADTAIDVSASGASSRAGLHASPFRNGSRQQACGARNSCCSSAIPGCCRRA